MKILVCLKQVQDMESKFKLNADGNEEGMFSKDIAEILVERLS